MWRRQQMTLRDPEDEKKNPNNKIRVLTRVYIGILQYSVYSVYNITLKGIGEGSIAGALNNNNNTEKKIESKLFDSKSNDVYHNN